MTEKMIKVSRYRDGDYTVNYMMNGRPVAYRWAGSQGSKIDTKNIPEYVVDWLIMSTTAIKNGSLVIEENEESKEIIDNIGYTEDIKGIVHTRAEIEKLLAGNLTNAKKDELNKITNQTEKDFIVNIAQELKIDSVIKREFLAEWMGIDVNMLFQED